MSAGDIFRGILAAGAGAVTGINEERKDTEKDALKRQLKEAELAVRMENIARLTERDQARGQYEQGQLGIREGQLAINEKLQTLREQLGGSLEGYREGLLGQGADRLSQGWAGLNAANERHANSLEEKVREFERLYGNVDPNVPGSGGARVGPDNKVISGGSASGKLPNLNDFPNAKAVIGKLDDRFSTLGTDLVLITGDIRRNPEIADKLIAAAVAADRTGAQTLSDESDLNEILESQAMRDVVKAMVARAKAAPKVKADMESRSFTVPQQMGLMKQYPKFGNR